MTMIRPLPIDSKGLDVPAQLAEVTGFVYDAARAGLPAHELEQGWWSRLLRWGHELPAAYFVWAGDGDCGERLTLTDGRVVRRWPQRHGRPYPSIVGDFTLARVVSGTWEGQRIEAVPWDARLGLPAGKFSYRLPDGDQALAVANPDGALNTVLARILGRRFIAFSPPAVSRPLS